MLKRNSFFRIFVVKNKAVLVLFLILFFCFVVVYVYFVLCCFFLGIFLFLLVAYVDIEQDLKKGTYNPLKKRYEEPGFEEECRQILTMMMSECCKEFEQLPILQNVDILRNILYSGVWCRYEIVRKKRMKDSAKEVTGNDL